MFAYSQRFCPIVGCEYFTFAPSEVRFFFVSKTHTELVRKWVDSIRTYMPDFPDDISNHRICQLHFDPEDLKLSRGELQLRFGAIPKRFPRSENQQEAVPKIPASLQRVTINRKPIEPIKQPLPTLDPLTISRKPQNAVNSGSTKCADCKGQIEAMQKRMHALQEELKEQQYEIATLNKRNRYLKTFEPEYVKKADECSICKSKLTTDELYLHLCQQLNNEVDIQCEYCRKSYSSTMKLLNHLRVSHNKLEKRFYRCKQCSEIFGMAKLMDIHTKTHPKEKPKINSNQNHNDEHTQTQHPLPQDPLFKPFQCGIGNCGERFSSPILLKEHMSKNHGPNRLEDLIANIEKRHGTMIFECYLCRKSFETFIETRRHIEKHFISPIGKLKAKCCVCWTNLYDAQVNEHLCEHVARSSNTIDCEYCPEKLTSIVKLFKHVDTKHANVKTLYRCITNCVSTFPVKRLLEYHRFVHTQDIYKCNMCSTHRSFQTLHALNEHIKRHEAEKVFLCDQCGKALQSNSSLEKHKLIHGPKLFKCDRCPQNIFYFRVIEKTSEFS